MDSLTGTSPPPPRIQGTRLVLAFTTLLYAVALVPVMMMAPLAFVGLREAGSQILVWLLVLALVSLPVVLLAAIIAPWMLLREGHHQKALAFSILPLFHVLVILVIFLLG